MKTTHRLCWISAPLALCMSIVIGCDNAPARSEPPANDRNAAATSTDRKDDSAGKSGGTTNETSPAPVEPRTEPKPEPAAPTTETPAPAVIETSGPSWKALDPTVHEFGTVWEGSTVTYDFRFRNVGSEPLKILSPPKGYCSCSKPGDYSKVVQPGEEGVIPYILSTKNAEGDLVRDLKVKFNDPKKPEWTIYMRGHVKEVCSIEVIADGRIDANDPAALAKVRDKKANFDVISQDETLFRVLRLVNTSGHSPLSMKLAPIAGDRFKATLRETTPGEEFELTLVGSPPYNIGYNNALIRLQTNVPDRPTWMISIYARLPERLEISPPKIVVNMKMAPAKTRKIEIRNHGDTPVKVTSLECSAKDYIVTLLPPNAEHPGDSTIEVIMPGGDYAPPPWGEIVRIGTTDAEKAVIEVPILPGFGPATPRPADKPLEFFPGKLLG
ncbi:MAG: DUF1573 domain-containing protein [Phycisphaerales bacterium]|nr:DUF1573 domain-containing protein [Phycisphaerales bacterium]